MTKPLHREMAISLRKEGFTIDEIADVLHVSKGSVHLWAGKVKRSSNGNKRYNSHRLITNARAKYIYKFRTAEGAEKIRQSSINMHKQPGYTERLLDLGHKTLLPSEALAKPIIEQQLQTTDLEHEKINGRYFDLTNDSFIIELSFDSCHGASDAIERFQCIKSDKRRKILIAPSYGLGNKRIARLHNAGAEFMPLWFDNTGKLI